MHIVRHYFDRLAPNLTGCRGAFARLTLRFLMVLSLSISHAGAAEIQQVKLGKPVIVASIAPVGLLLKDLLGDAAHVEVLLDGVASPHHFQLRMSDKRLLNHADLVVWLGEDMERFLTKPLSVREQKGRPVIELLRSIDLGDHTYHQHDGDAHDHSGHGSHRGVDPHIWLSPTKATRIQLLLVDRISQALPQYPRLREGMTHRLARIEQSRTILIADIKKRFVDEVIVTRLKDMVAFHDAYDHFTGAFDLPDILSINRVPDESVSAKHLARVVKQFDGVIGGCLLVDSAELPSAKKYALKLDRKIVVVDVLASRKLPYLSYDDYLSYFVSQFLECFAR